MHKITKSTLESKVKENLKELCKLHGAKAIHCPATRFGEAGVADYTIVTKCGLVFFCECKKLGQKPTDKQALWGKGITDRHAIYLVYDGGNDEMLSHYLTATQSVDGNCIN